MFSSIEKDSCQLKSAAADSCSVAATADEPLEKESALRKQYVKKEGNRDDPKLLRDSSLLFDCNWSVKEGLYRGMEY